jgi:hypothetical protein
MNGTTKVYKVFYGEMNEMGVSRWHYFKSEWRGQSLMSGFGGPHLLGTGQLRVPEEPKPFRVVAMRKLEARTNWTELQESPFFFTNYFADLTLILSKMQELQLFHNDIKPENLAVETSEETGRPFVRLLDWESCLLGPDPAGLWHLPTTPDFAASEVSLGMRPVASSDVYSFVMTTLHLLGVDIGTCKRTDRLCQEARIARLKELVRLGKVGKFKFQSWYRELIQSVLEPNASQRVFEGKPITAEVVFNACVEHKWQFFDGFAVDESQITAILGWPGTELPPLWQARRVGDKVVSGVLENRFYPIEFVLRYQKANLRPELRSGNNSVRMVEDLKRHVTRDPPMTEAEEALMQEGLELLPKGEEPRGLHTLGLLGLQSGAVALGLYSADGKNVTLYREINADLRKVQALPLGRSMTDELKYNNKTLQYNGISHVASQELMSRISVENGEVVVYRGTVVELGQVEVFRRAVDSKWTRTVMLPGFTSTSTEEDVAHSFSEGSRADKTKVRVFFTIKSRGAANMLEMAVNASECEYLYPPGSVFRVLSVREVKSEGDGQASYEIDLEDGMVVAERAKKKDEVNRAIMQDYATQVPAQKIAELEKKNEAQADRIEGLEEAHAKLEEAHAKQVEGLEEARAKLEEAHAKEVKRLKEEIGRLRARAGEVEAVNNGTLVGASERATAQTEIEGPGQGDL